MTLATTRRNAWIDAVFNATGAAYLSLHTADPGATGASEVTGGSYARQSITKAAAVTGLFTSTADIDFTGMPACTVTHAGVWDAIAGAYQWGGALTAQKTTNAGDTFRIPTGSLTAGVS